MSKENYQIIPNCDAYGGDISYQSFDLFQLAVEKGRTLIAQDTKKCVTIYKLNINTWQVILKWKDLTNKTHPKANHANCTHLQLMAPVSQIDFKLEKIMKGCNAKIKKQQSLIWWFTAPDWKESTKRKWKESLGCHSQCGKYCCKATSFCKECGKIIDQLLDNKQKQNDLL